MIGPLINTYMTEISLLALEVYDEEEQKESIMLCAFFGIDR